MSSNLTPPRAEGIKCFARKICRVMLICRADTDVILVSVSSSVHRPDSFFHLIMKSVHTQLLVVPARRLESAEATAVLLFTIITVLSSKGWRLRKAYGVCASCTSMQDQHQSAPTRQSTTPRIESEQIPYAGRYHRKTGILEGAERAPPAVQGVVRR